MRQIPWLAGGGLLVLVGLAAACGGGGGGYSSSMPSAPTGAAAPPTGATAIAIVGDNGSQSFNPNPTSVRVGATVVWQNRDGIVHHVVQDSDAGSPGDPGYGSAGSTPSGFDAGQTAPGATSAPFTAATAGVVRYHCTIHPGMVGTLNVTQ